ncbi:hypothetical protein [Herbaspirillum huttiense]|uniref:TnsA endonuclease N-terminal domain-containing protein n=1 Tax=Herbaspirillum huttiense subsp. lycopersici TaxID=3074428 RepID=A0ABU2EUK9_9BURK|nr:hypothetical protein [Herbaspirillum huttiense]MDR9851845.1 hypothetical protein [Herbaspirillum huttiense SE1]
MTRASPTYGRRGQQDEGNNGVRVVSSTFGTAKRGTYSEKAGGDIDVESGPERFAAHLLSVDPRVSSFQPQPFSVDLLDQRLLLTREEKREASLRHKGVPGAKIYTTDFSVMCVDGMRYAIEVKSEGHEGDDIYWEKIERARLVLSANGYPLKTLLFPADTTHPIRTNARLLKQALHQIDTYFDRLSVDRIVSRCERGGLTVGELCRDFELSPGFVPLLLVKGVLSANVAYRPINSSLELSPAYGDLSHLFLLEEVEL